MSIGASIGNSLTFSQSRVSLGAEDCMFLAPSPACLARVAQNPTPLRRRFGCSDLDWDRLRSLKPPIDDWVVNGQPASTLADLLRMTPNRARRLLDGWPVTVATDLSIGFASVIDEVVALGDRLPRIIVLPDASHTGNFHEYFERCDALGVVIIRLCDVERFSARLPR